MVVDSYIFSRFFDADTDGGQLSVAPVSGVADGGIISFVYGRHPVSRYRCALRKRVVVDRKRTDREATLVGLVRRIMRTVGIDSQYHHIS